MKTQNTACSACYGSGYGVDEKPCPCGCRPRPEPAIAPPVAAGSVDTDEFRRLQLKAHVGLSQFKDAESCTAAHQEFVDHINAWGAQQREAGRQEGYVDGKGMADEIVQAIDKATRVRAEKAEAELESWVHTNRIDELQRTLAAAEARVKELEGGIAAKVQPAAQGDTCAEMRALCSHCGGTGDVHSLDGEWRGECTCVHAWQQRAEKAEAEVEFMKKVGMKEVEQANKVHTRNVELEARVKELEKGQSATH